MRRDWAFKRISFFSPPRLMMLAWQIFQFLPKTPPRLIVGKPPSLQVHSKRCHFRILYAKCHYFHLAGDSILSRENCHGGIRGDNWKTVKGGSTSGVSHSCTCSHIPRDGRRGLRGVDYGGARFLSHVLLGGRRRRRKKYIIIIKREQERGSASQSISCHRLSPDGWMMDDCIFSNNTKTLPLWGTFCTGRNFVPASVCVQRQLASPILFFCFVLVFFTLYQQLTWWPYMQEMTHGLRVNPFHSRLGEQKVI